MITRGMKKRQRRDLVGASASHCAKKARVEKEGPPRRKLFDLIFESRWTEAERRCDSHPQDARWRMPDGSSLTVKDDRRGRKKISEECNYFDQRTTVLHAAMRLRSPPNVLKCLVASYPPAAALQDSNGNTPLHVGLVSETRRLSPEVIRLFVERYPPSESFLRKTLNDMLPLDIVRMILAFVPNPGELRTKTNPAVEESRRTSVGGRTTLHQLCQGPIFSLNDEAVQLLIRACPNAVSTADCDGNVPLHLACCRETKPSIAVYQSLVEADPGTLTMTNRDGCTPLHMACKGACSSARSSAVIQLLIGFAPVEARRVDQEGYVPLHHYLSAWCRARNERMMPRDGHKLVQILVEAAPSSLSVRERKYGWTPFDMTTAWNLPFGDLLRPVG